ncbi:MAG: hypothetical protein HOQ05_14135 [Corynebacteriales bacterium]|nr:hypothetical protein [Mycobacteriales bacterium]
MPEDSADESLPRAIGWSPPVEEFLHGSVAGLLLNGAGARWYGPVPSQAFESPETEFSHDAREARSQVEKLFSTRRLPGITQLEAIVQQGTFTPVGRPQGGHGADQTGRWFVAPAQQPLINPAEKHGEVLFEEGIAPQYWPKVVVWHFAHAAFSAGHAARHVLPIVGEQSQIDRLAFAHDPLTRSSVDWTSGKEVRGVAKATFFRTMRGFSVAVAGVSHLAQEQRAEAEAKGHRGFMASVPASDVLGPDFRDYIGGYKLTGPREDPRNIHRIEFPDDTVFTGMYRRPVGAPTEPFMPVTIMVEDRPPSPPPTKPSPGANRA